MIRRPTPKVLVTGRLWLGADGASLIGSELASLMSGAKQEVIIVAYRITIAVKDLRNAIEGALGRGCVVRIVVDASTEPVPAELAYFDQLQKSYPNLSIWDFSESGAGKNAALHAKMVIVDRSKAVIGSANFSRNGMIENHEIAILVGGSEAKSLARASDKLIENGVREGVLVRRS